MPVIADGPSLRDRLRAETGTAHGRVDALFGSCDLATTAGYIRFLRAQAAAWESLRPALQPESLVRADALRADLTSLAVAVPPPLGVRGLPDKNSLGLRYVLEGSRLGSTVLLREMQLRAPELALAARYFRESARIEPWKQLSTLLQTDPDEAGKRQGVIDDALFVFDLFERAWLATDRV